MKTEGKIARRNKIKVSRRQLNTGVKIVATVLIWLVFAVGIWENGGDTTATATVVLATLGMVIGTLYIWRVDRVQEWLRRNRTRESG